MSPPASDALLRLAAQPFDRLHPGMRNRAFGVDYARIDEPDGGHLYVTRYGWAMLPLLLPAAWYHNQRFATQGQRLGGSTGTVYRLPMTSTRGRRMDLVVKFSRFAQDVPLFVGQDILSRIPRHLIDEAHFNSPFEEVGHVKALRTRSAEAGTPILTKRPLAIYLTPQPEPAWRLGRHNSLFYAHDHALKADQLSRPPGSQIELDIQRDYVLLYEWVRGLDAEQFHTAGLLPEQDMLDLTARAADEMQAQGYRVLDHKPKHLILRQRRRDGQLLRRHDTLVYALVDFELLQPIKP